MKYVAFAIAVILAPIAYDYGLWMKPDWLQEMSYNISWGFLGVALLTCFVTDILNWIVSK